MPLPSTPPSSTASSFSGASPTLPEEPDDNEDGRSSSFYFDNDSSVTESGVAVTTVTGGRSWAVGGAGDEESGSGQEGLTDGETSSDFSIPERTERDSEEEEEVEEEQVAGKNHAARSDQHRCSDDHESALTCPRGSAV